MAMSPYFPKRKEGISEKQKKMFIC